MNSNTLLIFLLSVLISISSACGEKKNKVSKVDTPFVEEKMTKGTSAMMEKIIDTQVPFTWFAAKGQGKFDLDGQHLSARINVRILRDSVIWVQLQKFGFEVGRMLITPDSAFFINRFERTYSIYGTADFLMEYNVPADFEMFSKVFTAGAYLPPHIKSLAIGKDGSVNMHSATGMNARHWLDASSRLIRSEISDPLDRAWSSLYADYRESNSGLLYPYQRSNTLIIDGIPNVFNLQYSDLVIDIPQEFPFSIPSHYEKI